jgi:hypothetical protein
VGIRVLHWETGERIFKQDVFVAVVGARREELKSKKLPKFFIIGLIWK